MIEAVRSPNGALVRLTNERWVHIVEEHSELAGLQLDVLETVSDPERIVAGAAGELLAVREMGPGRWLVVVYRELQGDGFIITAFLTGRARSLDRRRHVWP